MFDAPRLYPIVDLQPRGASRALGLADQLLAAGAPWLQLRAKATPAADLLPLACELVDRAARQGARVIVNDRLDVAIASRAAGVHLGQEDLPLRAAVGLARVHHLVIGVSTHDVAQARAAARGGADYIGFGPMFPTASKANALRPREPEELAAVRAAVSLPIVAIGGIDEASATSLLRSGADSVAMIGALAGAPDLGALVRRLLRRPVPSSGDVQSS